MAAPRASRRYTAITWCSSTILLEVSSLVSSGPRPLFLYATASAGRSRSTSPSGTNPDTAGLIITSPWFRLAFAPPRWKVSLARIAAHVWPFVHPY